MYAETTKELLKLIDDTYPIEPGGMTKMEKVAGSLATMQYGLKDKYETLLVKLFPLIPKKGNSFLVRVLSFAKQAKFGKTFYASLAAFLKFDFHESIEGSTDWIYVRGQCILAIAIKYPHMLKIEWILLSSKFLKNYPLTYISILNIYQPNH
jgi:hypothetical protein